MTGLKENTKLNQVLLFRNRVVKCIPEAGKIGCFGAKTVPASVGVLS